MALRWELVEHAPEWIPAPYKINAAGDTKPGYLCIHYLENGNGLCGSTWFEESTDTHACSIANRGRWKYSRPCYDKYHRCPGWAGGGWKYGKHKLCHGDGSGRVNVDYEDRWWRWKTHRCRQCDVVVLPYMIRYTSPRQWWYSIERKFRR